LHHLQLVPADLRYLEAASAGKPDYPPLEDPESGSLFIVSVVAAVTAIALAAISWEEASHPTA